MNGPSLPQSIDRLRDAGTAERAGERVASRLADLVALLGADMQAIEQELARVARDGVSPATDSAAHLVDAGGKRVRPMAVLLSAACFAEPIPAAARELAVVAELVHSATLLHDDVVDDGQERRGRPTSRRVWGNAVSVLAGDLLLTHALERASAASPSHARASVMAELFATLRRLVDGEVVQLRGRARIDASEETYFRVVRDKTASLFVWATRAGARVAGACEGAIDALGRFGEHLGVGFQLIDDALDYAGDPRETGKDLFADLAEGKVTLPLVRTLARASELTPFVARERDGDRDAALALASAVRACGACDEVRALARQETERALASLAELAPSPARDRLAGIARELTHRAA